MNTYESLTARELFESSFVRYTHDKSDLTQEEVDQYIVLATEVVIASNIQRRVERLQQHLDTAAEDTEGRRIAMALVDAINTAQTEYNQCVNRQQKLLESLKEKRSDKLKKQIKENASILTLVEMWREEETRHKMIKLAERRKDVLKKEIKNLTSMDEVKARVMGISENEVLNG
jgi:allophanate hydrolase subunit 1